MTLTRDAHGGLCDCARVFQRTVLVVANSHQPERRRALRYSIAAPVQFRTRGGEWYDGTAVNMSRLGLLVRTPAPLPPLAGSLGVRIVLNLTGAGAATYAACTGRFVRTVAVHGGREHLFAMTIDNFRLCAAPPEGGDAARALPTRAERPGAEPARQSRGGHRHGAGRRG